MYHAWDHERGRNVTLVCSQLLFLNKQTAISPMALFILNKETVHVDIIHETVHFRTVTFGFDLTKLSYETIVWTSPFRRNNLFKRVCNCLRFWWVMTIFRTINQSARRRKLKVQNIFTDMTRPMVNSKKSSLFCIVFPMLLTFHLLFSPSSETCLQPNSLRRDNLEHVDNFWFKNEWDNLNLLPWFPLTNHPVHLNPNKVREFYGRQNMDAFLLYFVTAWCV